MQAEQERGNGQGKREIWGTRQQCRFLRYDDAAMPHFRQPMKMSAWGRLRWSDAAPSGELKRHRHSIFACGVGDPPRGALGRAELVVQIGFARWTATASPRRGFIDLMAAVASGALWGCVP